MPEEKTINLKNSEHNGALAKTIPAEQKVNNMITFKHGKNWFTFRAAALILNPGRRLVLLHKNETDPFWSLPGGRGEFFEPSAETVVREIMEEIGIGASVERLAFVIENFFKYGGCDCHELGFYYLVRPEGPGTWIYEAPCFEGREGDEKLYFKWFDLSELDAVELYPRCLRARLKNIPDTLEHIVHSD
ncbi:MAG TPA: NUDIX hydrolase [Candidatus Wallbacteria bacterium]|nr:NUDIX hydrolase [Candidatus Wallbacteria bacterium]